MKPIYKNLALAAMTLQVSVALKAQVNDGTATSQIDVPAEVLDSLRVEMVAPNVSGARDLIKSGECTVSDNVLNISLNAGEWIKGGVYRLQVSATFGTQTMVIYALDVTVPRYDALESDPQEYEDTVTVVSTYGDGDKSGADASVYAKDGDDNAHITTPMSVGGGVATGTGAIASGSADNGASIQSTSDGAVASGYADGGASIQATSNGAVASGYAYGEGAGIQADAYGAVVSGYADGGASIRATGDGAVASGYAHGEGASIQADSYGAVASGYVDGAGASIQALGAGSMAVGIEVKAVQDGQAVVGKCNVVDEDDTFQFIVGNGADDKHRSNGFAVTKSGELALFKADGTPIYLDASKLEALIAMLPTT